MTPRIKVVGLGLHLEIWGRQLHSGDIIRIPEEDYWYLKTMWPDRIYDLTPKKETTYGGLTFYDYT